MYFEAKKRAWLRKNAKSGDFVKRLSDVIPNPKIDFNVGDIVVYRNDFGVSFPDVKILAIGKNNDLWKYGNCIHLDNSSYWYPVRPESLTVKKTNTK